MSTVILYWSSDDGALYDASTVDDPNDPYYRKLEVTLEDVGLLKGVSEPGVVLTVSQLSLGHNDISEILIQAGKARFL